MPPTNSAFAVSAQAAVTITVTPAAGQPGRFSATVDGELIVTSSQDAASLDAARALVQAGGDANTIIATIITPTEHRGAHGDRGAGALS